MKTGRFKIEALQQMNLLCDNLVLHLASLRPEEFSAFKDLKFKTKSLFPPLLEGRFSEEDIKELSVYLKGDKNSNFLMQIQKFTDI